MIIKKPYAFLIKHFRVIHLILTVLILYLINKSSDIFNFFNEYVKNGYYAYSEQLASKYINFYMFIVIILVIVITAFIYLLMRWKKKSRVVYISIITFYFILFIGLLVYFNLFVTMLNSSLDVRAVRAYRDISAMIYFPQYIFLIIVIVRAIGFDLKKFDFKKDLEELDIAEEDQEEIEVTFGQNAYKYKRKARRIYREIKYYALENKFFFATICGALSLILIFVIYINVLVYNKEYDESEFFDVNGVIFRVENSYVSHLGLDGNIINKNKKYFIIKVSMENTNTGRVNLSTDSLRLMLDDDYYLPNYTKIDFFRDLGEGYNKNTLYAGEKYEYLLIFEVPINKDYKDAMFRMIDDVSYINGEISAKYRDVRLKPEYLMEFGDYDTYKVGEAISLEESTLKNSNMIINSYEIGNEFIENFTYCVGECYSGKKIIKPDTLGRDIRTILKLNMEIDIDDDLYIKRFLLSNSNFISSFATLSYFISGEEKQIAFSVKSLENIDTKNVYLEVPAEIANASTIKVKITIRNQEYIIDLK